MHLQRPLRVPPLTACLILAPLCAALAVAQTAPQSASTDIVFKNATVMTASHGTISHGSVWVHAGKIAGVGATVDAPSSAATVDATGLWLTPGIIDPHSHSGLDSDINEATSPVTPSMHMIDAFDNRSADLYRALAGGVPAPSNSPLEKIPNASTGAATNSPPLAWEISKSCAWPSRMQSTTWPTGMLTTPR